jgi:hypothetical protein
MGRQMRALGEYHGRREKLVRIPDIKELFLQVRERFAKREIRDDQATVSVPFGQ